MFLFNVYNLQNIWHFSIFIENTLYVQLVSCRNRTVGSYEEKLKKALESYIFETTDQIIICINCKKDLDGSF